MPIKFGRTEISDIKFGNNQISKVYHGNNLVWQLPAPQMEWTYQPGLASAWGSTETIYDCVWGGDKWCAIGNKGLCVTSSDGVNWTKQEDLRFKISSNGGSYFSMQSISWQEKMPGGPCFCVVGDESILTSPDGITWTYYYRPTGMPNILWKNVIWYGSDGPTETWYEFWVTGNESQFIVGNPQGGTPWQQQSSDLPSVIGSTYLESAAYSFDPNTRSQKFLVLGRDNKCATSTNLITWTSQPGLSYVMGADAQKQVIWTGNQFVTVGTNNKCATSPDGATWTRRSNLDTVIQDEFNLSGIFYDVTWNGSELIAVGSRGICATSPDGIEWQAQPGLKEVIDAALNPGSFWEINSVAWNGSQYLAVGSKGAVLTSPGI